MSWTENVPEPERSEDELRALVAGKARRHQSRRRLGLAAGAVTVVALLLATVVIADDGDRQLQVASGAGRTTTTSRADEDRAPYLTEDEPSTTVPEGTSTTSTVRRAPAVTTTTVPPPPNRGCADLAEETIALKTEADLRRTIPGVWSLCTPPSFFNGTEAGLEIRADGTWSKLVKAADGRLMRQRNWGNAGRWTVSWEEQVDFQIDGSGRSGSPANTRFTADRNKVRLMNPYRDAQYVRLPSGTTVVDAPSPGGDDCTRAEGGEYQPQSTTQLATATTGVWRLCQAPSAFGTNEAGLEVRADGTWAKLQAGPGGSYQRMTGPEDHGTWEAETEEQLGFAPPSGGRYLIHAAFAAETSKMRLNNVMPGWVANYVKVPPGTTITG